MCVLPSHVSSAVRSNSWGPITYWATGGSSDDRLLLVRVLSLKRRYGRPVEWNRRRPLRRHTQHVVIVVCGKTNRISDAVYTAFAHCRSGRQTRIVLLSRTFCHATSPSYKAHVRPLNIGYAVMLHRIKTLHVSRQLSADNCVRGNSAVRVRGN